MAYANDRDAVTGEKEKEAHYKNLLRGWIKVNDATRLSTSFTSIRNAI